MRTLLLALLSLAFAACQRPPASAVIDQFGTYQSLDGNMSLDISRAGQSRVAFQLKTTGKGAHIEFSDIVGSDAKPWCFYWDVKNRLWVYGSDTGYFAVIFCGAQGFEKADATTEPLRSECPQVVEDFLPSVLKRRPMVIHTP